MVEKTDFSSTDYMAVNQKGKRKGLYLFTLKSNGVTICEGSVKLEGVY